LAPLSYAERMPRALALPTVAVALLLLTSCTPSPGDQTPTASPLPDSPFISDDEAFAAAQTSFERYLGVANLVRQEGGANPGRLNSVSLQAAAAEARPSFDQMASDGRRQVGEITFDSASYESSYRDGTGYVVAINVCMDYSKRSVVDAEGTPVDLTN